MRILAIDYGTHRMGIAVSDELHTLATPLEFIPAEPHRGFLERLQQLLLEREVGLIVVGMPRNMDGSHGPAAARVQQFVQTLRTEVPIPVKTLDERLTTVQANRFLAASQVRGRDRKGRVDRTAAAILLQDYLNAMAWRTEGPNESG